MIWVRGAGTRGSKLSADQMTHVTGSLPDLHGSVMIAISLAEVTAIGNEVSGYVTSPRVASMERTGLVAPRHVRHVDTAHDMSLSMARTLDLRPFTLPQLETQATPIPLSRSPS